MEVEKLLEERERVGNGNPLTRERTEEWKSLEERESHGVTE
jgi:hypothetical protein